MTSGKIVTSAFLGRHAHVSIRLDAWNTIMTKLFRQPSSKVCGKEPLLGKTVILAFIGLQSLTYWPIGDRSILTTPQQKII